MPLMKNLLQLYQVDAQVRGLRSRLVSAHRYVQTQQGLLDQLQQRKAELETRSRHVQAAIGNQETELASVDARIEKLRDELNSASTNKQYSALLVELNTFKAQRGEIEERMLGEMETVEQVKRDLAALEQQIAERAKVRAAAGEQLREREQEIGERLSELEAERGAAAAEVPGGALGVFEEAAGLHEGEAMAPLDEIDRRHRDYACGACHMTVPFEHVSLLLTGGDTLVRCSACGRILYMQEETRGAFARK